LRLNAGNVKKTRIGHAMAVEQGGRKPFYPDFVVARKSGKRLVVSVLEPHDDTRADTWAKAKG
jgi:hypothetical protein